MVTYLDAFLLRNSFCEKPCVFLPGKQLIKCGEPLCLTLCCLSAVTRVSEAGTSAPTDPLEPKNMFFGCYQRPCLRCKCVGFLCSYQRCLYFNGRLFPPVVGLSEERSRWAETALSRSLRCSTNCRYIRPCKGKCECWDSTWGSSGGAPGRWPG